MTRQQQINNTRLLFNKCMAQSSTVTYAQTDTFPSHKSKQNFPVKNGWMDG